MDCVDVGKDYHIRVYGPARLVVERGRLLGPGYEVDEGREIVVRSTRGASFYSLEESRICYVVGSSASVLAERLEGRWYEDWLRVVNELRSTGARRILVVGEPETGKSTMSLWVRNSLGLCLVEADIGQNELGLPGMVAAAPFDGNHYPVVNDVQPAAGWFVGHVSAEKVTELIVSALLRATRYCSSGYVADTDGYIKGRGLVYKLALVESLEPDAVVVMGDNELARLLKPLADSVYVASRPPTVRERDRVDRRAFRERAYSLLFRDAETMVLRMDSVVLLNHEACRLVEQDAGGARLKILDCGSARYLVERAPRGVQVQARLLRRGWERGLLAGVGPLPEGRGEAPAVVEALDYARSRLVLRVSKLLGLPAKPEYVVLGFVRLDESLREVEKLDPQPYPKAVVRSASRPMSR